MFLTNHYETFIDCIRDPKSKAFKGLTLQNKVMKLNVLEAYVTNNGYYEYFSGSVAQNHV